jgi:hypothetical protein
VATRRGAITFRPGAWTVADSATKRPLKDRMSFSNVVPARADYNKIAQSIVDEAIGDEPIH